MSLTLWSGVNPENARTHKLLAAAALANVAVTLKACDYGRENETAEYCRNCSPCGRYPVLQTEEGCVFESNAILRHIARLDRSGGFLYGRTPLEAARWTCGSTFRQRSWTLPPHRLCTTPSVASRCRQRDGPRARGAACAGCVAGDAHIPRGRAHDGCGRGGCVCAAMALPSERRGGRGTDEEVPERVPLYNTVMQQPKTVEVLRSQGATFGPVKAERKGKDAAAPARAEKKR
ncbi:hypothetical protein TcBrA4_0053360, partial [Trypanosoma cruzi]